jgi:hydroxyethylthiazole kinase-like uncharacterized protein yjeF
MPRKHSDPTPLTEAVLQGWPLPRPGPGTDKDARGRVLVVAGSREIPGAALLAAESALRAGAGKLAIAAPASVAPGLALAIPEARVVALAETPAGGIQMRGVRALDRLASRIDALVVGPGMMDEARSCRFVQALLPHFAHAAVILDASAMGVVRAGHPPFAQPVLMTPNAGEMAHLLGIDKEAVAADPLATARQAAARWNAVVALKGAVTHLVEPGGTAWRYESDTPGLATSGSGDTLAGIIGGLAARGLPLARAAAWGIVLHSRAGTALAASHGPMGYLAREIPPRIPALLHSLDMAPAARSDAS